MPKADSDSIAPGEICNPPWRRQSQHEQIREARKAVNAGLVHESALKAFGDQLYRAKQREIPFLFSWDEWWRWWQIDGRWEKRGLLGNGLVMARHGDVGPYSWDNVYCATVSENLLAIGTEKRSVASKEGWRKFKESGRRQRLWDNGHEHPLARVVITPAGRFESTTLAAKHYGITKQGAAYRARVRTRGWSYEEETV